MDIFMTNIGISVKPDQLKIELAGVLHKPPYSDLPSSQSPMNLEIIIHRKKPSYPQRSGILTVPTTEIGNAFLRDFGGPAPARSLVLGTRIKFQQGKKAPRPNVLEEIRRLPYLDPRLKQERERIATDLRSRAIPLRAVQFGWECRDNVFSIEWERIYQTGCELIYDEERREFHVKHARGNTSTLIIIRASQIAWASAGMDKEGNPHIPVVFLSLNYPPSYETDPPLLSGMSTLQELFGALALFDKPIPRQRWSHLEPDQAPFAPFVSTTLRLLCERSKDIDVFCDLCHYANMQVDEYLYPAVRRGLFSLEMQEQYARWIARLPWTVAFQVEAITKGLYIDLKEALGLSAQIANVLQTKGEPYTVQFLKHFATQVKTLFWYSDESRTPAGSVKDLFSRCEIEYTPPSRTRRLRGPPNPDNFDCLHVTVTPTTINLDGPHPERSNRVMRLYPANHDSFIRVNFVDETGLQYRFDRLVDGQAFIRRRVGTILADGLDIAGRHFEFLAYSQSALKEHAVWFVKEFRLSDGTVVNARTIIANLGDFTRDRLIYCPARYAARISQAFTATDSSVSVEASEMTVLDDIMDDTGKWCFTDGVGTISTQLARDIWKVLAARRRGSRWHTYPRAFQVRVQGAKGMLSVDHLLEGRQICLRPSMIKFEDPASNQIEIARAFNRPGPFYLNRPLIMVLEDLGVPYEVFRDLQHSAVVEAQSSVESLEKSARLLERFGLGASFRLPSIMLSLHKLGLYPLDDDEFWQRMMDFAINHVLRELKHHARIPVQEGWNVVGVADVHGWLEEEEVFGYIVPTDGSAPVYLEGPTLVTRSPTIHPGDVQIAHGIGPPPPGSPFEYQNLRNTLVFSTKGSRPLPSFLGGGDLDGDEYRVTMWEPLIPPRIYEPAEYAPAPKKVLDRPSTMRDVAEFVTEYINSDTLGIIAVTWLIIADQSTQGIFDPDCYKLSDLHSNAVDYPKSGVPVPVRDIPRLKMTAKPDWNAPETVSTGRDNSRYYPSQKAIGKLYRAIDLPAVTAAKRTQRKQRTHLNEGQAATAEAVLAEFLEDDIFAYDEPLHVALIERIAGFIPLGRHDEGDVAEIWDFYCNYASQLQSICVDHTLSHERGAMLTEEEAVIGTIVAKCSQPRRRKDLMSKLREQATTLVDGVRFDLSGEEGTLPEKSMERGWIAFRIALLEGDAFGARSFSWIAMGEIFDAIKVIEESEGLTFD